MKAFNQRTTVLSYIASLLARKSPDALRLHQDVPSLAPAARLTREGLGADLGALRSGLGAAERVVRECCSAESTVGAITAAAAAGPDVAIDLLPLQSFVAAAQVRAFGFASLSR